MTLRGVWIAAMIVILGWSSVAISETDPSEAARMAAAKLSAAALALEDASGASDRVRALSTTIEAFEEGLQSMREGLRRASLREQGLRAELAAREVEIARLLGVLLSMESTPTPVMLLHPDGPTGTVRAGMLLSDVTPALASNAREIRQKLEEVTVLRALQESAVDTVQDGLRGVQEARAALSQAIADRTDLPRRFIEDPVRTAILISSTETLDGFASGLDQLAAREDDVPLPDISTQIGELTWPVAGEILRHAGEADLAGVSRPGVLVAARPKALVTTPSAATIRYRGPLLDYGNVMILEPRQDTLFVLAGLETVYGEIGQVLPAGSPVGLMGGKGADLSTILSQDSEGAGNLLTETLYIEVRQGNSPVNPETWFKTNKE